MTTTDATLKRIEQAKQRLYNALQEYGMNMDALKGKIEWKDLTGYLDIWNEEYTAQSATMENKDKLFQLAILIGNLDIQLDMLRPKDGWQQFVPGSSNPVALPEELEKIRKTVASI